MKKSSIHCLNDARNLAKKKLPEMIFDYVDGTALEGDGEKSNYKSFQKIKLVQNVLSGICKKSIKTKLFNYDFDIPFGIAPMGMCNLVNSKADISIARLARKFNIPVSFSTMASTPLEVTYNITGDLGWFQLYVYDDLKSGLDLALRAQSAGYKTLILTVDVPDLGRRPRELKHNFKAQFKPSFKQIVDCSIHPLWGIDLLANGIPSPANFGKKLKVDRNKARGSADWNFLKSLRKLWKGNLIVKGILNPKDAKKAEKLGADAIYVSGHGSRQFDSSPIPIEQLPKVRSILQKDTAVIFDTGVRNGEDIIKAKCLGADLVMIGKPALFSIGAEGMLGLTQMVNNLAKEIEIGMSQMGVADFNILNKDFIYNK